MAIILFTCYDIIGYDSLSYSLLMDILIYVEGQKQMKMQSKLPDNVLVAIRSLPATSHIT